MWKKINRSVLDSTLGTGEKGKDLLTLVISTKDIIHTDKLIPVVNIPPLRFVCRPTNKGITYNIKRY